MVHRHLEDLAAGHADDVARRHGAGRVAARRCRRCNTAGPGKRRRRAGAWRGCPASRDGAQHHGAGAIAEQDRGAAIRVVGDARQRLGAHHQRALRLARADELVGDRQRIDEAAAGRLDAECRAAACSPAAPAAARPQLGNTRSGVVVPKTMRSMSSGFRPAAAMARARGVLAPCRPWSRPAAAIVAALDAGALADPRVGGVHALLQVGVVHNTLRAGSCRCR